MRSGSPQYLELLERRLELLRTLILMEGEWRRAFIRLNIQASECVSGDEEIVCHQVRTLDKEIASLQTGGPKQAAPVPNGSRTSSFGSIELDPTTDRRIRAALQEMATLHLDLRRSNQVRRAILRRANLTRNALYNLFNSYAPTYAAPAAPSVGTMCQEKV